MSKQKKVILGIILLIVLFMGVGYAALSNIELTINGTASATVDPANFKVYFTGENTIKSSDDNVEVTLVEKTQTATVNFSGLTAKDDSEYVILEIKNDSNGITTKPLSVEAKSGNEELFEAKATPCDQLGNPIESAELSAGDITYVKVSTKLLHTATADTTATITVKITAEAKEN